MSAFPHARYLKGAHEPSQFVPDLGREVAFAGRSNSGKSSAINAITQRHGLAKTSKTPGLTQLINFFELEPQRRLVDLPGYGFAKVPRALREHWRGLLDTYFRERNSLAALFLTCASEAAEGSSISRRLVLTHLYRQCMIIRAPKLACLPFRNPRPLNWPRTTSS